MADVRKKREASERRHTRVRKNVVGTPERPRLNVYRSLNHIYAQVIDDSKGYTLACASTLDPEVREQLSGVPKSEQAAVVGSVVARRALEKGITKVVFDRGSCAYHGRVQRLAEAARKGGLDF